LGIEEEKIGAPIRASMKVVDYGETKYGIPVNLTKKLQNLMQ
jgi:hypothetical protein